MKRPLFFLSALLLLMLAAGPAVASDPPHSTAQSINCTSCHITHHALGGAITKVAGNPNLCQSCHASGGLATNKATPNSDEALPNPGLPTGQTAAGSSHRWDSGASGHVAADAANTSTGKVQSGGAFTGPYPKTYTLTMSTAGDVGTARFNWTTNKPVPSTTNTYLDQFNAQVYTGSNGTTTWSTSWVESDVGGGGATGGNILVRTGDSNCPHGSADNCLRITATNTTDNIYREANLSGATSATLTYAFRRDTTTGTINIQASNNGGGSYTTLKSYTSSSGSGNDSFDITSYIASNTRIRFQVSATGGGILYVDDVQIQYVTPGSSGGGTNVLTASSVTLDEGITAAFSNGSGTPTSFKLNDKWYIYVRTDLRQPTNAALITTSDGKIMCSTCHDQHSQALAPFDPSAPAYGGSGTGWGRHFQAMDNTSDAMCKDCHNARNISPTVTGKTITGAANNGSGLIRITATAHGFATGDYIRIAGVAGTTEANDSWTVTVIDVNRFDLQRSKFVNAYTSGGTATELTSHLVGVTIPAGNYQSPATRTITGAANNGSGLIRITSTAHGFSNSDNITIMGVTGTTEANGTWIIANVAANTFDLQNSTFVHAYTSGGTATHLPLQASQVQCSTCHRVHYSSSADGTLQRSPSATSLCTECHTLADTATPAIHLNASTGVLWPGGQYGSLFPQNTVTGERGYCTNCHQPHGWPDGNNPTQKYPTLLVDREENLCYTCHDANGPAPTDARTAFGPTDPYRHPVDSASQAPGRQVECTDCHNSHKATGRSHTYSTVATSTRNTITAASSPLTGASGVSVNYTGLGNFVAPASGNYTAVTATLEYQICFKCHSGYSFGTTPPAGLSPIYNTGTATFTASSATVTGSGTTWVGGMVGAWIRRSTDTTPYKITAASATSITITPAYAGTTGSGQTYVISLETDNAQEFSLNNKSGHPIVTGLNNYPNSTAPKALTAAAMSAPWSTNLGTQTMMCADCHNTDAASPAAQGPHGSAIQFMLRGPNTYWPTDSAGAKYNLGNNTSGTAFLTGLFCMNCHPMRPTTTTWVNNVHDQHSGPQGNFTPDQNACVACHIVIPHGGKVSRLIATRTAGLPARYAYSNNTTNVWATAFIKAASPTGYNTGNCDNAGCSGHGAITGETW